MKLLGIDYGTKRTGLALGDTQENIAIDLETIEEQNLESLVHRVIEVIAREHIDQVVVGLPLGSHEQITEQTKRVQTFGDKLADSVHVPVVFEDERLTTAFFQKMSRKERVMKSIDGLAAMAILQSFMDRLRNAQR